ncbi:MAG: hypothetical protein M3463_17950 [Verrucomicrobiota bacterium]|nr:hypothetical protein [Verrucomicrobiota bacterium]
MISFGPTSIRRREANGSTSHDDDALLRRIEEWAWLYWGETPHSVPVHVLAGEADWRQAAWMLASWFHYSESGWPVHIHDDGTLPPKARTTLQRLFLGARVISRAEADDAMSRELEAFSFCDYYRRLHPLALRIFDVAHFSPGDRFILLDSDLLFFALPREALSWASRETPECWFLEDIRGASLLVAEQARVELGVELWSRVNTGLALVWKKAVDLEFCDRCLAQTSLLRGHLWRVEPTLYALCAARHGKGGLLPLTYEVSLGRDAESDAVARHYVGAVRSRFYSEGLARLVEPLFADNDL